MRIRGVDVDTSHFLGNAPGRVSIEATHVRGYCSLDKLLASDIAWTEILKVSDVKPGSQNLFAIEDQGIYSHVKLRIYPDGGVARFRVYGEVAPDWELLLSEHRVLDLAAVEHGGVTIGASDEFFSDRRNLLLPGPSRDMGDGWESRRRRGPGYDWAIVRLGRAGSLVRAEIDTTHFKGNYPDTCSLEACAAKSDEELASTTWREILPRTKLEAHTRHTFALAPGEAATHVRLNIFPDGGVARLRIYGAPV